MITTGSQSRPDFLAGGGEMGERIRVFDWTATPLGPLESWPQSLKTSVSLILSSRHPMWLGWGPAMTFLYNDAYVHVLGAAKHPGALGLPASVVWAEIWDVCGPLANKVFEQGEATFMDDVRLFMNRGDFLEETFYSFSYSPIRDESGQVSGLFCPSTDVTPKIVNARRLRTLSELAANALAEKTIATACASFVQTLSKNPDDIPFALLYLVPSDGVAIAPQQSTGVSGGAADPAHWPIADVLREGQRQIVSIAGIPGIPSGVADQPVKQAIVLPVASRGEHQPYGVLALGVNPCRPLDTDHGTFFDLVAGQLAAAIQSAKEVEQEKKRADMLAELDRAKTVFFSNVSHEFRTPLTLMLGPLESMLAQPDGLRPEDYEHLVIAHRNSLRLLKLVNSLLDFSRIEAGRVKATFVPTDLAAATVNLASNFRSAVQTAGLTLDVDCPPLRKPVYVDGEMWEKIVLNLLSNAFKFTFEGKISVRMREQAGNCVLSVSDTGIGIPESELPHIFERFHRVAGARGRTYEGTGIGLALIQELVKVHGGSISVESRAGEGSTFYITLPFGTAHLPPDRIGTEPAGPSATAVRAEAFTGEALTWLEAEHPVQTQTAAEPRARVLLADDNADMREHVSRILGQDYALTTASDGQEALEIIRRNPPDLVVSDVMMPGLDGLGLLREIRSDPRTSTLAVILVSARAGEEMRVEGLQAGADDYLVKPFTANELRARVGTHVQMALARRLAVQRESELRAEAEAARDQVVHILESINDAFVSLDGEWRITYVNAECERLHGMKREDMAGRKYWELFPAAPGNTVYEECSRAVTDQVPVEFENYYEPWQRWFHVKAYPAANGGLSVFYTDVTARKQAEAALIESERKFRQLADSMPQIVWTAGPDGHTDYYNDRWYEFTGFDRSHFGQFSWEPILHPDDMAEARAGWAECVVSGKPFRMEQRFWYRVENRWRWFMGKAVPVSQDGSIVKWIGTSTDIDEQKRVQEELRRLNQDLEQFAYSASHDLQEPLRGVKIYTELLSRQTNGKLDGQALEFLNYVRGGASRMELLIRDLLAYTQVSKLEWAGTRVDANEALKESLANLNQAIQESRANITAEPLPSLPVAEMHLKQLFQNLIGNAVKYRHADRCAEVQVGVNRSNEGWVFSVKDNGIGIEPQYKERIFGIFKRLHSGDEYSGTGIGLAICQRIVERYHGRIWVESEPGQGSCFFFTLPM